MIFTKNTIDFLFSNISDLELSQKSYFEFIQHVIIQCESDSEVCDYLLRMPISLVEDFQSDLKDLGYTEKGV